MIRIKIPCPRSPQGKYNTDKKTIMKKIKKKNAKKRFIIEINEELDREVNRALEMVERKRINEGESVIAGLLKNSHSYHTVQFGMGVVHAFKGRYDEAISCFKKAVDIFPYFLDAQFNLAVAYQKRLDLGNTIRAYQKVIEIGAPEHPLVRQAKDFLSNIEEHIRKEEGIGLNAYLKGMDIFEKACNYMEIQEWEKAISSFKDCLNIVKRHYQSYGNMGLCYAKLAQREQALAAFDSALEINPRYEPAIVNRALIAHLKEGERMPAGPIEIINYSKEYVKMKRSYITEIVDSFRRIWK
jgi:tetratricopeptide (TPR) repeat protein